MDFFLNMITCIIKIEIYMKLNCFLLNTFFTVLLPVCTKKCWVVNILILTPISYTTYSTFITHYSYLIFKSKTRGHKHSCFNFCQIASALLSMSLIWYLLTMWPCYPRCVKSRRTKHCLQESHRLPYPCLGDFSFKITQYYINSCILNKSSPYANECQILLIQTQSLTCPSLPYATN